MVGNDESECAKKLDRGWRIAFGYAQHVNLDASIYSIKLESASFHDYEVYAALC